MFAGILDTLQTHAAWFRDSPVFYTVCATIVITVIYFKWKFITSVTNKAAKQTYAGWTSDVVSDGTSIQLKNPKSWGLSFFLLALCGGGMYFYWQIVLPETVEPLKDWSVFAVMCLGFFSGIYILLDSFTKIEFDGAEFRRKSLVSGSLSARISDLQGLKPIRKSIANGAHLEFSGKRRLRVYAQMSGYRQLLEMLAKNDPDARRVISSYHRSAQKHL